MQDIAEREDVLTRNGLVDATWVETGTYLGQTTKFLSHIATMVYSIEPGPKLFADAVEQFKRLTNVEIINGLSEDIFPKLLPMLRGDVCFWLDGHYTDELTHRGPQDTPIADELACISNNIGTMGKIVVMIDDVHLFNGLVHVYGAYPQIEYLMDWATRHKLSWHIEHDIFIAKN